MTKKRFEIYLTDEQIRFLEWLVEYDNEYNQCISTTMTVSKEISCCAETKINELMDFYIREDLYQE